MNNIHSSIQIKDTMYDTKDTDPVVYRLSDRIPFPIESSNTDRPCSLFNTKHHALITSIHDTLINSGVDCEIFVSRLTTPQKRRNQYRRNGFLIHSNDYHYIKCTFKNAIDGQRVNESLYIYPYTNKISKTKCKLNIALSTEDKQRDIGNYYSSKQGIVNSFQYISNDINFKMDDDFKLDISPLINGLKEYDGAIKDHAAALIKSVKRNKLKDKTILNTVQMLFKDYNINETNPSPDYNHYSFVEGSFKAVGKVCSFHCTIEQSNDRDQPTLKLSLKFLYQSYQSMTYNLTKDTDLKDIKLRASSFLEAMTAFEKLEPIKP